MFIGKQMRREILTTLKLNDRNLWCESKKLIISIVFYR